MDSSQIWNTRAVIVRRDESNGYGLTLSGDNPVQVQTVKRDGAAHQAGIREGDIIVKVNGTLVDHMNHTEVVNLIRAAGPYVTLTVKPSEPIVMPGVGLMGGNGGRQHHLPTNDRVTAPLPVNQEIQQQLQGNKLRTLQAMRDKAQADVERLWKKYEMSQSSRDMNDFEKAQQGLKKIETQMKLFRQSTTNLQLHAPAPFNSYPHMQHQSVPFQPYPHQGNSHGSPILGSSSSISSADGHPPRHRNPLSAQASPVPAYENVRWGSGDSDKPPPLPPRSYPNSAYQLPHSQSPGDQQHIPGGYPPPPGYSPHDPLAQMTNNSKLCNAGSPLQQTHHRAKSSPDPVAMQKALSCAAEGSRRSDSVNDLSKSSSLNSKSRGSSAWGDSVDATTNNHLSPPGSPPPPYGRQSDNDSSGFGEDSHTPSGSVNISSIDIFSPKSTLGALNYRPSSNPAADIISMEEDDGLFAGDVVLPSVSGKQGPYSSLSKLLEHNAHLAVFINYVIDNRLDPSSLLFYLITGLNLEDGSIKEMKRWCYEIHSTFTAPRAPLLIPNVAENIATEIDDGLLHESDKEEMMRRVFRKARNKAKDEINKQLEEFCNKRTAGLGSMFGPPDNQLEESINDPLKQQKIVETYLLPRLDQFYEDYDKNQDDKTFAVMNAIATVLIKQFGIRNPQSGSSVIEKCTSFVSKEKSIKMRLVNKHTKKVNLNGHHLTPQFYHSYTECNICSKLLWGVGPQGYQCVDCHVNIHRGCMNHIQDNCLGTSQRKDKANDKFRKFKEKIRPNDPLKEQRRRINAKKNSDESNSWLSSGDLDPGDRPLTGSGSSASNLKGDKRPDTLSEERLENDGLVCEEDDMDRVRQETKRSANVGRSESCKEPQRKQPRERRKHSDPNLTSKSSDVDLDNQRQLCDANSGSSSSSSLSARSLDSPKSSSLELVNQYRRDRDSETPENPVRHSEIINDSSCNRIPGWEADSDIDVEQDLPDWTINVPEEVLSRLDRVEKKRQGVLNELFHTERLYVCNLKILDRLFSRPIKNQQLLSSELIHLLFPKLEDILDIHEQFNCSLKKKRTENPVVGDIGPVLLEMFDGERGGQLKSAASTFCARQQIALDQLREKRRRDTKFHAFLTDAESNSMCRRLGLKDMIPTVMQRLAKYPMLFERLCNATAPDSIEYNNIQRALELSKEILTSVNFAKKEAEDEERLQEIQRRLDKSYFEKGVERTDHAFNDLRSFDFTRHKLIYDGDLWRVHRPKGDKAKPEHQEALLVLLEDMVVLLLKVDDRYVLKMHNVGTGKTTPAKPIIKLNTLHATRVASDKRAFYLVSKTQTNPFMLELSCNIGEERTSWLQHITRAADDYKSRQESRRSEVHPIGNIPPSVSESEDRSKETGEVTDAGGQDAGETTSDSSKTTHLSARNSNASNINNIKDASPAPESHPTTEGRPESPQSPEKEVGGDGKLSVVGGKGTQSVSSATPSPAARRKQGEFLRVTESSPLIDPSEVTIETTQVHFAKIISSPYEELKRCDSKIHMAFDEKLKLISKLCHIPSEGVAEPSPSDASSPDGAGGNESKDAKKLVVACIQQVDKLGRLIATQKFTSENIQLQREQLNIHKLLNSLLAQLLSEVHRKDEDLELRRQELYRIREQNHGYQERLQAKSKAEQASLVSPVRSPTQSRPNSYVSLSSSSDHHDYTHDDETEVAGKVPLKPQLSAPVASSSSNNTSPSVVPSCASVTTTVTEMKPPSTDDNQINPEIGGHQSQQRNNDGAKLNRTQQKDPLNKRNSACESAHEEFADALEDMVPTDWDSGVETNRESTETEVVASTKQEDKCQLEEEENQHTVRISTDSSGQEEQCNTDKQSYERASNSNKVPEIGDAGVTPTSVTVDGLTNGHNNNSQQEGINSSDQSSESSENNNYNSTTDGEDISNGKCGTTAVPPVVSKDNNATVLPQQEATQQS